MTHHIKYLLSTLFALAWLVWRWNHRRGTQAVLVLASLLIGAGALATSHRWDNLKTEAETEARFYLDHPDRLLYSKLPAPWYLFGIHELYLSGQPRHYLSRRVDGATTDEFIREKLNGVHQIWVNREGTYVLDEDLPAVILKNLEAKKTPLHKGWPLEDAGQ